MSDALRVRMSGITKRYGPTFALRDVTFEARPGEIHALIGENGAGKSTLVRVLSGAIRADAGEMAVDGVAYDPRTPHDAHVEGIRAVHQEFSLVPQLSVAENLLLGELPTIARGIVDWHAAHRVAAAAWPSWASRASTRTSASTSWASRSARWWRSPRPCGAPRAWSSSTSPRPSSRTGSWSGSSPSCAPSGLPAAPSSTSRTVSTRCCASPIASPSSRTASAWAPWRRPRSPTTSSSA